MSELLEDFIQEDEFAKGLGVSTRTVTRYRHDGLPWMLLKGKVQIHKAGSRQWLLDRMKRHTSSTHPAKRKVR